MGYKRALFKIQSMQKAMNQCACKGQKVVPQTSAPLGILNGATKQSRKRASIELPIVKIGLKPSQQSLLVNAGHKQGREVIPKANPESPTPEKAIRKYVQYLKTGPFENLPKNLPTATPVTSSEPPMKEPKLSGTKEFDFQAVLADVFCNKSEEAIDI